MFGENLKQMELLFQPTLRTKLQMVESSNFGHLFFSTAKLQQLRFSFDLKAISFHSQNAARYPEIYIFNADERKYWEKNAAIQKKVYFT
jgi:hypothetical protein